MAPDLQSLRRKICLSYWSCLCTGRMWVRTHAYRRLVWNCAYQLLLPESAWMIGSWSRIGPLFQSEFQIASLKRNSSLFREPACAAPLCYARNSTIIGLFDPRFPIWSIEWPSTHRRTAAPRHRGSWGELNAIGCVWCRRPWDTANIDFFIGSILRVMILFFRQTDTFSWFFNMQHSCQRFNAQRESKIPYSGANTSTGRKSSRDSWKSARWIGALRPTLLGYFRYFVHFCSSMNLSLLSFFWVLFLAWLCCVLLLYSATWYMYDIIVVYCAYTVTICYFIVMFGITIFIVLIIITVFFFF